MRGAAPRSDPTRGLLGAALVAIGGVALSVSWAVSRPPPDHPGGILTLLLAGLGFGLLGLFRRPSWQVRAGCVAALVLAAIALNLIWFPAIDQDNTNFSFARQPDGQLKRRYFEHHHWIPRRKLAYYWTGNLVANRPVEWIRGSQLLPRLLLTLSRASQVTEIGAPDVLPAPVGLAQRHKLQGSGQVIRWKGKDRSWRLVHIRGAASASSFVAVQIDGLDYVIAEPVWTSETRRPGS